MMDLITEWVGAAGYAGVAALMFLENLFPPIPSELIMPFAGFAAARGELTLTGVVLAGVLGTLLGNAFWFEAARAFGAERSKRLVARFGGRVGVTREDLDAAEAALRRWGPMAVFFGRMMPGIRTVISIPAGLIEMPRLVFYAWTTAGTFLWVGALALLGFMLEEAYTQIEENIGGAGKIFVAGAVVLVLLLGWRAWKRRGG
ncbi:MAG TPA: DedA family protein [Roseococcus sp.]|jgi:membrane protein DedA with SNARE-associated domain|nr:DedA family protein [Roseococcus sp.]